jgi:D-beta-D-heptose 7-phosphate kinase/D-beta-D-heptose 1-phosphate adenosyltransferase
MFWSFARIAQIMHDVVSKFSQCRALVIGDVMLDEYLSGEASRLSPEAPVPILRVLESRYVLGGAGNTAANLVSLGARVTMLCLLGRDTTGDRLARRAAGLGIEMVPLDDGRPTPRKTRVVGHQQQMVRLDYEDTRPIDAAMEAKVLAEATARIGACDIVILPDYSKGLLTEALTQGIIKAARRLKPVVIDPRPNHGQYYVGCDYLTPNWKECLGLLGRPEAPATAGAIDDAGRSLAKQLNANIVLTLGPQGIAFFGRDQQERFHLPTVAREVFDVSGAGDTVVAAFSLARASGASHEQALAIANHAAGIVIGKFGTATVTATELLQSRDARRGLVVRSGLPELSVSLKGMGKRIVTINGSFDLFHAGHLYILQQAREQGDVLIVGLNSDASVKRYKGSNRPLVPEAERADLLLGLRCVDYVHIFDEADPIAFLEAVRPDVHVNGAEYGENCIEASTVKEHGGRLHLVDRIRGLSTSALLDRIRATMPKLGQPS